MIDFLTKYPDGFWRRPGLTVNDSNPVEPPPDTSSYSNLYEDVY